jgi:hypothetical protein
MRVARAITVGEGVDHDRLRTSVESGHTSTGVMVLPHASCITGGVGGVASAAQLTVEAPSAGSVKSGYRSYRYRSIHASCQRIICM